MDGDWAERKEVWENNGLDNGKNRSCTGAVSSSQQSWEDLLKSGCRCYIPSQHLSKTMLCIGLCTGHLDDIGVAFLPLSFRNMNLPLVPLVGLIERLLGYM